MKTISFRLISKRLYSTIFILAGVNLLFLIGTALIHYIYSHIDTLSYLLENASFTFIVSQFNLAGENTLATWYSSMLLGFTGILALLCFQHTLENRDKGSPRYATGWLVFVFVFMLLSLDEMGSIHENAGHLVSLQVLNNDGWESVLILPVIAVALYMIFFAWLQFKEYRKTFYFIALGSILYITIPLQEHLEMKMWEQAEWRENWNRPIFFVLMEEGIELFGTLAFIYGMTWFISNTQSGPTSTILFKVKQNHFLIGMGLLATLFVTAFILLYNLEHLLDADEGIAINWFPAFLPILILVAEEIFFNRSNLYGKIYAILLSMYFGANFYALLEWESIYHFRVAVQILMISGLLYFIYSLSLPTRTMLRLVYIAGGALILPAFVYTSTVVVILAFAGMMIVGGAMVLRVVNGKWSLNYRHPERW